MSISTETKNAVDIQGTVCLPIRIFFVKDGPSKYMSHLDLMRCMTRTIRRAGIPVWYTEGFNPHLFMTFAMPLSLGASGLCETMDIRMTDDIPFDEVMRRLNGVLCEGIYVTKVDYQEMKATEIRSAVYRVSLAAGGYSGEALKEALNEYLSQEAITVQKKNKKKQLVDIDVKPHILSFELSAEGNTAILLIRLPAGTELNINPSLIVKGFEQARSLSFDQCDIVRERILTASGADFR